MTREDGYNEEYSYDRMATLELGIPESRRYHADLKLSDKLHPCVKYKTWMFSLLIGSCLLGTSGFSLYLGNIFPSEMDYLRCAAGSCIPSAVVSFAVLKNKENVINFNLMLLILMEILMATTVIISARTQVDCCPEKRGSTCGSSNNLRPVQFPARMMKFFSIVEVVVGISAVFGGVIALHIDVLLNSPYLYVSIFWVLAACFPCAIASYVAAEFPSQCVVEVLIATSSITAPLLFTTSSYLSIYVIQTIAIFKNYPPDVTHFYEVLLLLLMLILLVQAVLTNITVILCVQYKSQMRMLDSTWNVSYVDKSDQRNNEVSNNTLRNFDKEKAWKAVMVQMTQ
ncbi:membrane protein MLC1 isoform X7 [Rana temporaria]|uniref:membrane protein MLC1 isoform X7 n=1 Tax=Rana temporaria TaxID=8407 RepID=UPI001AAD8C0C|nr:membrane protein MLC1 isoform X7 [Rana temporaria]